MKELRTYIENDLEKTANEILGKIPGRDIYNYALFPAGKLFRSHLLYSYYFSFHDSPPPPPLSDYFRYLSAFLEFHHTYSLIHDDLPVMDNDDFRRGKMATHKKFSEWEALLVGDGLLNASYAALGKIKNEKLFSGLFSFISWAMGPRGLILGQYLDLACAKSFPHEKILNKDHLLHTRICELKTARLIQVAVFSAALILHTSCEHCQLSKKNILHKNFTLSTYKILIKLGSLLGIVFQMKDDQEDAEIYFNEERLISNEKKLIMLLEKYDLNVLRHYLKIARS